MIQINFVENEGKYYLMHICFEDLKQVKEYLGRWFPSEDAILCQVKELEKKGEDKCSMN